MPRHRSKEAQAVRCIALLMAMARAKRGIQLRQFSDRKGWNVRAAYRDIETLRDSGVPIEHEHGWFRVAENWIPAGTVDIRREELLALFAIRHVVPGLRDTIVGRSLDSLCAKLAAPTRQASLPLGEEGWFVVRSVAAIDYGPHLIAFNTIREAIQERRAVRVHYQKPDGVESVRIVEPAFLCWDAGLETLYVRGWCRLRDDFRTFAVHRILAVELTPQSFVPRRDAARGLDSAFRIWCRPGSDRVVIRFSPAVAREIRERRLHRSQVITNQDDGSIVVEMTIAVPEELERWLLGFGPDVEVIEPVSLAARIRQRHAQGAAIGRVGTLRARPRAPSEGRTRTRAVPENDVG